MRFNKVLEKYRKYSFSERDKGERFERLMQAFLLSYPLYASKFTNVWMWDEFPAKKDFGGKDTGIDLVAKTKEGDYWAIQCKCFQESSVIDKKAVDSFLSTSSRTFKDDQFKTTGFSQRLWLSTTDKWGSNAEEAIRNQTIPFNRFGLSQLKQAEIDWELLEKGITGEQVRTNKKTIREHQLNALEAVNKHFKKEDRGKLIMACGTGKTYASLKIAENEVGDNGLVLFLVPSIALLGQTLNEWTNDAEGEIHPICICSDSKITKKRSKNDDSDLYSIVDLALPASTDVKSIVKQLTYLHSSNKQGLKVVFSTYQSIEVISEAQKEFCKQNPKSKNGIFNLVICDEAHRTTGVALTKDDSSHFIKIHDNEFIKADKRLYMTATPRLYNEDSKSKAAQADAILCSMDDHSIYGEEVYRIGFGEAVDRNLLTDYKVLILTLNDNDVPPAIQKLIAGENTEINSDDASKLIGCINALSKQVLGDADIIKTTDPDPMRRAVAFCQNIKVSKKITNTFNQAGDIYLDSLSQEKREKMVKLSSKHIDGSMGAPLRDELLGWLKEDSTNDNECKVLTNVRCLSEGVDVPSLDSVLFLSPRNSQVDVVQSVGRVMRKSPGKKYGYIIIPVVVPSNVEASVALDDNDRYKVVWSVLNALRAHDDRFKAIVNKIELNKKRPSQILVGRPDANFFGDIDQNLQNNPDFSSQIEMQFEQLQSVVFARMVQKVGDKRYWEQWAKDVAKIVERQYERINRLIKESNKHEKAFQQFLKGLRKNINPSISEKDAVDMLSQHIITKPVFEALFEEYSFVKNNPISKSMQKMLSLLEEQTIEADTEVLDKFYSSVKKRASGIDNAEGKQRVIIELYDSFFKTAFPKLVEKLGIVYTPVEVVDFIIYSVNDLLKEEFGRSISDENIHILDPFTGTGTFITRLLQSGLISKEDLLRKYAKELHANEIVLLAYYIAAVNIENAYHDLLKEGEDYKSFDGICLTDTFQLGEPDADSKLFSDMFPQNSKRVEQQKKAPLRVIIGNPPYSVGQKSANDIAQNQKYTQLDNRIESTYSKKSRAINNKSLYDAYIKAFRWSADRLDPENGGVIAFVSNGAWIEGNSTDGFRKCLEDEFSSIYVFNLRGNQRTSGELSRKEGGKIFGSGSRTPISITLLVKNPNATNENAKIHYHDIGDYLKREEKLQIVKDFATISNPKLNLKTLNPNKEGDWINKRNESFKTFIPAKENKKGDNEEFFTLMTLGIGSNRDIWVYNFSKSILDENINTLINTYNNDLAKNEITKTNIDTLIELSPQKISWSRGLKNSLLRGAKLSFNPNKKRTVLYRPYTKLYNYFDQELNEYLYQMPKVYPVGNERNLLINITGKGSNKGFTILMSNCLVDMQTLSNEQCFPLYYYEKREKSSPSLFDDTGDSEYVKRDGVSDFILERAIAIYGNRVSKEDIFYYVYGILHSTDYRITFANDLKKMLPRIPLVDEPRDFWKFSKAGRELADLHINYESVPPSDEVTVVGGESGNFKVNKIKPLSKDQKDTILYNSNITIKDIPEKAYKYVVNGKSAIDWILDRYQVKTDKKSGITNNPNDWADEVGNPRYILDLLLSVINLSCQTVDIVNSLPKLNFEEVKES